MIVGVVQRGLMVCVLGMLSLSVVAAETRSADQLLYREHEPGTAPYPVRILVTDAYMRIDDGRDEGDYVLFDRRSGRIQNVLHDTRTLVRIDPAAEAEPGVKAPGIEVRLEEDTAAPAIDGKPVQQLALLADGEICMQASVIRDTLPGTVSALAEYQQVLAGRNIAGLMNLPADLRTPCYLANQIFAAGRQYDYGLPVQEMIRDGRARILMDYRSNLPVDATLFNVPEGYQVFEP